MAQRIFEYQFQSKYKVALSSQPQKVFLRQLAKLKVDFYPACM